MKTFVAFFGGLNVGGNSVLPMKELVAQLENIGLRDVRTYIQSGNAAFRSEAEDASLLSKKIGAAIEKSHGFEPQVLLLGPEELEEAVESNPPEAESKPKSLHLYFLAAMPEHPNFDALEAIRGDGESFVLEDGVFYLHAPDGAGRSKLAANVERLLGVPTTARNWRTVRKAVEMAKHLG